MATTIGIKVYCDPDDTLFTTYDIDSLCAPNSSHQVDVPANQIVGVQNIPELQTAPSGIDVTSIEDVEEQSEPGLISGSTLNITMNYKKVPSSVTLNPDDERSNFQQCLNLSNSDKVYPFKIVLPNGRYFGVYAKIRTTIGAMAVASAMQFTVSLYKKSKVTTGYSNPVSSSSSAQTVETTPAQEVTPSTSTEETNPQ